MLGSGFYIGFFVILFFMLMFILNALGFIFREYRKLLFKLLWRLFITSFALILAFSFLYTMIFMADISLIKESGVKEITKEILQTLPDVQGFNIEWYKKGVHIIFLDFFFYSASIYLGLSHEIQIFHMGQLAVSIERFLGVVMPFIITLLTVIKKDEEKKDNYQLFHTYLNRNWNVLRTRKSESGDFFVVDLINSNRELAHLYYYDLSEIKDAIKSFRINWSIAGLDFIPYFTKVLDEPLLDSGSKLRIDSVRLFSNRNEADEEYFKLFYQFLQKVRIEISIIQSEIPYQDFEVISNMILEKFPNVNNQTEVSDDE